MIGQKDIPDAARTVGGFIVGVVSVLGWMNITPCMVGQLAYDVLYHALPVVTFVGGAMSGWGITKLRVQTVISDKDKECAEKVAAKEAEIEKIRRDCERRVFEATMPLDRTISLTKPQAEVVVGMIDRERAGEDTVLSAWRGGDAALDSLAAKGVLHKEPFKSFYNLFDYTMDPEWLSLFRKHESEVRDIAAR